ncbi:hypothetical protein [Ensifer soli]|uniref:hypothetical protein n=1 Tax=Ciceribacter sp. sgz301302 TaxID=3342379 RepID=UPI0035BB3183
MQQNVQTLNGKIEQLHRAILDTDDVALLKALADQVKAGLGENAARVLIDGNRNNPFFVPSELAWDRDMVEGRLAETTLIARTMAGVRATAPNILVACAPKSGSTFISAMLAEAANLAIVSLTFPAGSQKLFSQTYLREQEFDELALLQHGVRGKGYVAQHHVRCTPYLCRQLAFFHIRPIVTYRNVFDCLVSLDDMFMSWRDQEPDAATRYFKDGLPDRFTRMERADRLIALAHRYGAWYLQFYLSWKTCERMGLVSPLWISYERDFLADKAKMASDIAGFVGAPSLSAEAVRQRLEGEAETASHRLNRGIAGRGEDVPAPARAVILSIFAPYEDEFDLTDLLGSGP